jgi:RHS repeat-associated protein
LYKEYIEEVKRLFRAEYIAYCSANKPKVSLTSLQQTYHYTLYYYDQAGNLVRTVPPEGVHPLDDSLFAQIAAVRRKGNITCSDTVPSTNTPEATALQKFTTVFDYTGDAALEMWMFNQSRSGGQVIATTSGNKYIFNLCISGKYLNFDVYTITPLAGGETDVVLSAHTTADLTGILPLTPWTHVVIQGDGLKKNSREIYVNGKACPRVNVDPTGACPWEIRSGGAGITYPKNLTLLKQARFFSRKLTIQEISANADDACLGFSPSYAKGLDSAKLFWMRFGIPAAGSYWTIDGTTTETQFVPVYPKHTLTTSYAYQSLNGIEAQSTPDGGTSRFWYDMLGRMVASQNAEQLAPLGGGLSSRYSYTNYDGQGRIKEVGETKASLPDTVPFLSSDALTEFGANPRQQVTRTYYDAPQPQTVAAIADAQDNLRKRVSAVTYGEDGNGNPQRATYYSYDQIGNVKTLWQQIDSLGTKQIDYQYDLVSGKVNKVRYQAGKTDQFLYGYEYDAENRLTKAFTGVNTVSSNGWEIEAPHTDAAYRYYLHGPLARTELGNEQLVQGIDYAYTLQGWLKGVNGNYLSPQDEIGRDGLQNTWRSNIARDAYGYSLEYFKGDYKAISDSAKAFPLTWTVGVPTEAGRDLFNGNISRSTLALKRVAEQTPVGYSYRYDELNRLKGMRQHPLTVGATEWNATTAGDQFKEAITYDGNGNILSYLRNGSNRSLAMDQLSYVYSRDAAGNLLNNKLSQVVDNASDGSYTEDIKTQTTNNYLYDNIGNLLSDKQGKLDSVRWTLYGKIRQISKADGSSLEYAYDPSGNRVYKKYTNGNVAEKTWYVRDAQGNVLAVYGNKDGDNQKYWKEQHLYGSSRLGIWTSDIDVTDVTAIASDTNWLKKGRKQYELTNHLGNVLATISDKVVDSVIGVAVDHYEAEILSAQDYYPFGMLQPDRKWSLGSYRFGFNGKENDNEVKGKGNQLDFGARIYDPRVGKFLSTDPMEKDFPEESPYSFAGNGPTFLIDYNGLFKISPYWVRRYPTLAKIVQYYLPLLKDNQKVKDAWVETAGYKSKEAGEKAFDKMVTFGEGPWISPRRRSEEVHTSNNVALGGLLDNPDDGGQYNDIYYQDNLFIGYSQIEALEMAVKKGDANAIAEAMFFVTTAIMHESAHYGMFKLGKVESSDWSYEAGAMFEQKVFGERFSYRNPQTTDREKNRRDRGVIKNWFEKNKKSTTSFGLSSSANFYNYYGMVKNAPAPQGQKGDKTVTGNYDVE